MKFIQMRVSFEENLQNGIMSKSIYIYDLVLSIINKAWISSLFFQIKRFLENKLRLYFSAVIALSILLMVKSHYICSV